MVLAVAPSPDNITVDGSLIYVGLQGLDLESVPMSTAITRLDVSLSDIGAVVEVVLVRLNSSASLSTLSTWLREHADHRPRSRLGFFSNPGVVDYLGRFYVTGRHPFVYEFPEPVEAIHRATAGENHVFALSLRRVDSEDAIKADVNIWFGEY